MHCPKAESDPQKTMFFRLQMYFLSFSGILDLEVIFTTKNSFFLSKKGPSPIFWPIFLRSKFVHYFLFFLTKKNVFERKKKIYFFYLSYITIKRLAFRVENK